MPVARFLRGATVATEAAVAASTLEAVKLALRIDGDEADSMLARNIAAAGELADRQAPDAPTSVRTEAIIRAVAYFFEGAVPDGSQPAAIWRVCGAQSLLSPWTIRRAGAIG